MGSLGRGGGVEASTAAASPAAPLPGALGLLVSTPRTLALPDSARRVTIKTSRGAFAALEALPATGVCERSPALLVPGFTGSKEDFLSVIGLLAAAGRDAGRGALPWIPARNRRDARECLVMGR